MKFRDDEFRDNPQDMAAQKSDKKTGSVCNSRENRRKLIYCTPV
jgi:hypothetical protein